MSTEEDISALRASVLTEAAQEALKYADEQGKRYDAATRGRDDSAATEALYRSGGALAVAAAILKLKDTPPAVTP